MHERDFDIIQVELKKGCRRRQAVDVGGLIHENAKARNTKAAGCSCTLTVLGIL